MECFSEKQLLTLKHKHQWWCKLQGRNGISGHQHFLRYLITIFKSNQFNNTHLVNMVGIQAHFLSHFRVNQHRTIIQALFHKGDKHMDTINKVAIINTHHFYSFRCNSSDGLPAPSATSSLWTKAQTITCVQVYYSLYQTLEIWSIKICLSTTNWLQWKKFPNLAYVSYTASFKVCFSTGRLSVKPVNLLIHLELQCLHHSVGEKVSNFTPHFTMDVITDLY